MIEFRRQGLGGATIARRVHWRTLRPLRQRWLHQDLTGHDVAIASYPRSGNLWLRVLLLNVLLEGAPSSRMCSSSCRTWATTATLERCCPVADG